MVNAYKKKGLHETETASEQTQNTNAAHIGQPTQGHGPPWEQWLVDNFLKQPALDMPRLVGEVSKQKANEKEQLG